MRVIIANYRYFIAGGPEKYMFKFMESAKKMGIDVIPFSVNNPQKNIRLTANILQSQGLTN